MAKKRNIRKLPRSASAAFEEQVASVQWTLVVWALLLTVLVVALGGWQDPRFFHNGVVRLIAVAVTWGLLAWLATKPSKWMQQRLRFGVALSLVLHTVLLLVLLFTNLMFLFTEPITDIERQIVMRPEEEIPEVVEIVQQPEEQQEYEKPVMTDHLAEEVQSQAELAKAASPRESMELPETPELASTEAPKSMLERKPRAALAHRAKAPGKRSRQTENVKLATTAPEPLLKPKQATTAESTEPTPTAKLAKATPTINNPQQAPEQPSTTAAPSNTPERRQNTDAPQVAETKPTPQRRQSLAKVVEPATASVAPSVTTPEINRVAAEPSRLERPRERMPSPREIPAPERSSNAPSTPIARRDTREPEMTLAAAPTPIDRRNAVSVAQAVEVSPSSRTPAELTRTKADTDRAVEPVASSLAKQQEQRLEVSKIAEAFDSSVPTPSPSKQPNRKPNRLAVKTPSIPTPSEVAATSEAIAKAVTQLPDALAAAVPKETTPTPSTSPAPRMLADSRGGTGMKGAGLNNLNDEPAPSSRSAPFTTSAAKRNRSTQTERGPSLAPNPVARVAKGRASAVTPQSTLAAIPNVQADVAGSSKPDKISASSSAATDRKFANVALGDITAARGEAEFDTGPPQITPEKGRGRGSMGGRMAMQAPSTKRGLGPRQLAQAAMSPSAVSETPNPIATAAGASSSNATVARAKTQAGGSVEPTVSGRPGRANRATLAQARAPMGATSGGGASPPSVGPPPATANQAVSPSRSGGSLARTRSATGRGAGPSVAAPSPTGGTSGGGSRSAPAGTVVASTAPVPVSVASPTISSEGSMASVAPSTDSLRDVAPKRPALMVADLGEGGLSSMPTLEAGIPQRVARRQVRELRMAPSRFDTKVEGGDRSPPGRKRNPAPAFAARSDRRDAAPITSPTDPRPKTEAAIELGLEFLARTQRADGSWSLSEFGDLPVEESEMPTMRADGAATGMALLAFLGGGYDHYGDKYRTVVERGLDYLMSQQTTRGDIFPERDSPGATRFYSHGIATLALCEAYGMTGDPKLEIAAQAALDYITKMQHPRYHGWRYTEGRNSDLSVTGWQMMALRSGQLAGLKVNENTYRRVGRFVEQCRATAGGGELYCYNPYTKNLQEGMKHYNRPSTVMTAVGMLMKLYLGENRETPLMQKGADHLAKNLPTHVGEFKKVAVGTQLNPQRDTYYWYYATQVMFHMGGEYWDKWFENLHPLLVENQTQEGPLAGSWNPQKPVPDMWGGHGGRLYVTCLNLLSLEVSYRHLPLYEMTGK